MNMEGGRYEVVTMTEPKTAPVGTKVKKARQPGISSRDIARSIHRTLDSTHSNTPKTVQDKEQPRSPEEAASDGGYLIWEVMSRLALTSRVMVWTLTDQGVLKLTKDPETGIASRGRGGPGMGAKWEVASVEAERSRRQDRAKAYLKQLGG
jgi:hypothetical protein